MNKQIRSYHELTSERRRLEILLQVQKQAIYNDIEEIKERLEPVRSTFEFVKKMISRDKTSLLLNIGSDLAINSIVQKFILSKAGWVTKLVVPFFLKNYSSHVIAEQKDKWIEKLKSWITHRNGKEQHKEDDSYANEQGK